MNKVLTILSFGLAVAAFVYIFYTNVPLLSLLWFILACIIAIIGMILEKKIKRNSSNFINKLAYFATRNGAKTRKGKDHRYNVDNLTAKYSILENNYYELKYDMTITAYEDDLREIEYGFSWTTQADDLKISPIVNGQTTTGKLRNKEDFDYYTINFNKSYLKKKKIDTGSIVRLHSEKPPKPFFAYTIRKKTKVLTLELHFDKGCLPENKLVTKVYTLHRKEINLETLINDGTGDYHITIKYPRFGWRYVISWEENERTYLTKK